MNTKMLIITSLRSLQHHKGRSLLTTLGIIIGIAALIATMAIGKGAEEKVKAQIIAMGQNSIYISPGSFIAETKGRIMKKTVKPLTLRDVAILKQYIPNIRYISPVSYNRAIIKYNINELKCDVKGGNEQLLKSMGRKFKYGISFHEQHLQKRSRVVVLGQKTTQNLFKFTNPIGQIVHIGSMSFTVIGVLKKIERFFPGSQDPNNDIFIPITTAQKIFGKNPKEVDGITLSTYTLEESPQVVRLCKKIIRTRHFLEPQDPDDFMVWDQQSMLKAAQASSDILTILLLIIASISLLVGGIGVMNIMLVSVTERTQEIGIRMALGASEAAILRQFLCETVVLCLFGGLLGIGLGIATPYTMQKFTDWTVVITPWSIITASSAIIIVALIFGYYPAYRASRLEPVTALVER